VPIDTGIGRGGNRSRGPRRGGKKAGGRAGGQGRLNRRRREQTFALLGHRAVPRPLRRAHQGARGNPFPIRWFCLVTCRTTATSTPSSAGTRRWQRACFHQLQRDGRREGRARSVGALSRGGPRRTEHSCRRDFGSAGQDTRGTVVAPCHPGAALRDLCRLTGPGH
jgi:hypothetical protein